MRELLRTGQFDLLHFSGHGAADPDDILDAKLLLAGRKRRGTVEAQYLGATTVSANAAWAQKDERDRSWCSTPARSGVPVSC